MTTEDERREEKKVDEPAVEIWLTARKWRMGVWFWWWSDGNAVPQTDAANGKSRQQQNEA
jgi:hypothetical protein